MDNSHGYVDWTWSIIRLDDLKQKRTSNEKVGTQSPVRKL